MYMFMPWSIVLHRVSMRFAASLVVMGFLLKCCGVNQADDCYQQPEDKQRSIDDVAAVVVGCLLHDHTIAWDYLNHGVRLANPYGCSGLAHYACHGKVVLVLNRCNLLIYKGGSGMVKS